jgi:hypothetical protein
LAEVAVHPVVGRLSNRACVDEHHIGGLEITGRRHAIGDELAGDPFGVMFVHLATEGPEEVPLPDPGGPAL